ncbi:MAG: hypothetical protein WCF25_01215 [Acidimicrobiales bacterium]
MEVFVRFQTRYLDAKPVIEVASDVVALDYLDDLPHAFLKSLNVLAFMTHKADRDESSERATAGIRIDDRPIATNHLSILKASKPS